MNIKDHLHSVYDIPEAGWVGKNAFVFDQAKSHGLALAGSIAISVAKKKASKNPSDLDFVCASFAEAQAFINSLERKLTEYQSHWRVFVNHNNEHVPPGAISHFRFQSAMWLPICVMVIPVEKFRFWLCPGGLRVQLFEFAKNAALEIGVIDKKNRDLEENDVAPEANQHLDNAPFALWDEEPGMFIIPLGSIGGKSPEPEKKPYL